MQYLKIIIFLFLLYQVQLLGCKTCSRESVYQYIFEINTSDIRPESIYFPSFNELNIKQNGGNYLVDDTMMYFHGLDTTYNHFFYEIKCEGARIEVISFGGEMF